MEGGGFGGLGLAPAERRHHATGGVSHDAREGSGLGIVRPDGRVVRVGLADEEGVVVRREGHHRAAPHLGCVVCV